MTNPGTVIVIRCNMKEEDGKTSCIHEDCRECRILRSMLGISWDVIAGPGQFEIVGEADEWK